MNFPRVRLEVDFGSRSSIGELSLISIGYGLHQAWIYGSMFDNGSIFGVLPSAAGFFNEAISLTYMISLLIYGLILLIAAVFDRFFLKLIYRTSVVVASGVLCSVGTFLLLSDFNSETNRLAIEAISGILTGVGSSTLLLAWGVAFSRRDTSTIAINGALAIVIGFTVYSCILHALPHPYGGIVSGLIPFVEVAILLALQRMRPITEINTPMSEGLPINTARFALIFGLPVLFLGFALGIMRQFSISTVLEGASRSDQSFIFMMACFATIFLLMVFLGPDRESGYSSFFKPLIPFIAITVLFIPFAADADSGIAVGILLMGYMIFEAMMWVFFGQLSQQFRLSPVLVFGLGRGVMSMSSLGGSLLPIAGNSLITSSPLGSGVVIIILIIFMMFAFSLLPSEKTILSLTTFSRKTEEAVRRIDTAIAEEDGGFVATEPTPENPEYVEMGNEVRRFGIEEEAKRLTAEAHAKADEASNDGATADSALADTTPAPSMRDASDAVSTAQNVKDGKADAGSDPTSERQVAAASTQTTPSAARQAMERRPQPTEPADSEEAHHSGTGQFRQRCENVANTFLLSKREAEVMFYLARGFKSSNIQEILYISEGTAKTHIRHIYRKLDVHSQSELMKLVNSVEL